MAVFALTSKVQDLLSLTIETGAIPDTGLAQSVVHYINGH